MSSSGGLPEDEPNTDQIRIVREVTLTTDDTLLRTNFELLPGTILIGA